MAEVKQDQSIFPSGKEKQGQRKDARGEQDGGLERSEERSAGKESV